MSFKKTFSKLILFKELVYIVEYQQTEIIWIYHDNLLKEHCEVYKTIKAIFWLYYFLYMWRKVINYVSKCDLCHKIKLSRHKSYEKMKVTLILDWLWASTVINFIVKLSLSKKFLTKVIYNLILIIVDQLIKKTRFILYLEASDAEELAYMFL